MVQFWLILFLYVSCFWNLVATDESGCNFYGTIEPVRCVLCSIENGDWTILPSATAMQNAGCLLGGNRCASVMKIPSQLEVPPSPPPPDALNKDYQRLATIAEKMVPVTWWRQGFDSDLLLLSHNDSELPRKQFNIRQLSNKKLRNFYQCVSRQVFIRISMDFDAVARDMVTDASTASKCVAMSDSAVKNFFTLWNLHRNDLGGSVVVSISNGAGSGKRSEWYPLPDVGEKLHLSALEVLQYFYSNHGGIWTGCFKLDKDPECRGALAGRLARLQFFFLIYIDFFCHVTLP